MNEFSVLAFFIGVSVGAVVAGFMQACWRDRSLGVVVLEDIFARIENLESRLLHKGPYCYECGKRLGTEFLLGDLCTECSDKKEKRK